MNFDESPTLRCSSCDEKKPKLEFSQSQLRKIARGKPPRCRSCIAEQTSSPNNKTHISKDGVGSKSTREVNNCHIAAGAVNIKPPIKIAPRPQRPIPGFEGTSLTCCADWPKTKNGKPPSAQSAIFMPLLAMVVGPIEGYNTQKQLEFASQWWSEALPAWNRWVDLLREAGVHRRRGMLIQKAKGQPNSLIPRAKGYGMVPHFRGQMQTEAIESSPIVAVELYACVMSLYSSEEIDHYEDEVCNVEHVSEDTKVETDECSIHP